MLKSTSSLSDSQREQLVAALRVSQEQRRRARTQRFAKYQKDPVAFVENALLGFLWSKQREICESVRDNRFTAVKSCHDVGKSAVAARLSAWWLSVWPPGEAFVVTSAPTFHQVKAVLWREINAVHRIGGLPGYCNQTEWIMPPNEIVGFGRAVRDTDPTSFQGIHARRVLVVFDEAGGMTTQLWDAAETLIANEDSRFLAIGNPDDPASEFARSCKPGSGYNVIRISAFDSPNFTGEKVPAWLRPLLVSKTWVDERRKKWGEKSPLWISKATGEFPEQSADGLIPLTAIRAAVDRELEPGAENELGVDVARHGQAATVVYHRIGSVARRIVKTHDRDLMSTVGEVVKAIKATGANVVKVDDTGLGGGVTDRLIELRHEGAIPETVSIVPVNVGIAPIERGQEERFTNLRAQLNWQMRERFVDGRIDLDDEEDVLAQAGEMKYKTMSNGKIAIESKPDMEKRGIASPDDWDALVLCFASAEIGGSMTFTAAEKEFVVEPFEVPGHWARVASLFCDRSRVSCVWGAVDTDSNVVCLYGEYSAPLGDWAVHADAIRKRGSWIPVVFNHREAGRSQAEGRAVIDKLVDLHVELFTIEGDREGGIMEMAGVISGKRLKVFSSLPAWVSEYRAFRRDAKGEILEGRDQMMFATGLLVSHGIQVAAPSQASRQQAEDEWNDKTRSKTTGY